MRLRRWVAGLALLWAALGRGAEPTPAVAVAVAPPLFDGQGRALHGPLSPRVVGYEIDARLFPETHQLVGHELLRWRNLSSEPQGTLWFHLYWNAFKNARSTVYREGLWLGGFRDTPVGPGHPDLAPDDWGYSDVKRISVRGGANLLPSLRFQHPDDDNADDQTVFTVALPSPVPPGGEVTLEIDWEAHVPKAVARAGHWQDYFLIGQWFPKLGVLEVPPTRGATRPRWNCHQYHDTSEFYADFGTFDVRLTVPAPMRVGATGMRVSDTRNADGTATYRYHQDDVHDFAWTAWPGFAEAEALFQMPGLPEVRLTALYPKEHEASRAQLLEAMQSSLRHYGEWYGPYPYPQLTVVAPPPMGEATLGMEYPTFIVGLSRKDPQLPRDYAIWDTVSHEVAHNYFYGLVASNEFEEPWLDEGIAQYATSKFGELEGIRLDVSQLLPVPLRGLLRDVLRTGTSREEEAWWGSSGRWESPVARESWKFLDQRDYKVNAYARPKTNLKSLERSLGPDGMARVMRAYVDRWRFRHPDTDDFFEVASEVSGRDLSGFERDFFRSSDSLDYAVQDVRCIERDPVNERGVFDTATGHVVHEPAHEKASPTAERLHECLVLIKRLEALAVPVTVQVTFEDGSQVREAWDGRERWHRFHYLRKGPGGAVREARVDPDDLLLMDRNRLNNARSRAPSLGPAFAVLGWLTYVGQLLAAGAGALW